MAAFRFKAINAGGEVTTGMMEAPSEAAVIERLRRDGAIPVRAEPADAGGALSGVLTARVARRGSLSKPEIAAFTRELAIMLGAGQDLDRALRFLVETAPNPRVARTLGGLRDAVRDGSPLAAALGTEGRGFSRLYVGMVRAGESGGQLAATLERLALMLERQRSLAATVTSAMIYPALLTLAAIGSIVLLLVDVLPQFVPLFAQNGVALPRPTQILIDVGDAVAAYGLIAMVVLLVLALLARKALTRPGPRLWADRALLRVPVVGGLVREVLAARLTRTLGTLIVNGVALIAALGIVREAIGNRAGVAAIERAIASARNGAGLAGLEEANVFPARTLHLLRLGHETAQLGQMALRAADIHEEEVRIRTQRLVSLLVPAITIALGVAVAGIVSSLMLAMLSLNNLAG